MGKNFEKSCEYFEKGRIKASTLSLTVLVTIEMLNAMNALSEDCSLLTVYPWKNMYLMMAIGISFIAHFAILYIPLLATTFSVYPIGLHEWKLVLIFSIPVLILDEMMKWYGRNYMNKRLYIRSKRVLSDEVPLLRVD